MINKMMVIWAVALSLLTLSLSGCGGTTCPGCESSPCVCEDVEVLFPEETVIQPEKIDVVIDQSASMAGYFNMQDMRPILQTINTLQQAGKETGTVKFLGGKPIGNIAGGVLSEKNFSADTDMDNIFKQLVEKGDSIPVAFITDGIVSTAHGINDIPQMVANIRKTLEGINDKLAFGIYRMATPYSGKYWIESSRGNGKKYQNIKLDVEGRPYFAVIIGPKEKVRWIDNNVEMIEAERILFNTHDDYKDIKIYPTNKDTFTGPKDGYYFLVDENQDKVELAFKYPFCLESVFTGKPEVSVNGEKMNSKLINKISTKSGEAYFNLNVDELVMATVPGENKVVLTYYTLPNLGNWSEYSTTDDSNIATDSNEQEKTYGLEYLIKAMKDAQTNDIVTMTFNFKN